MLTRIDGKPFNRCMENGRIGTQPFGNWRRITSAAKYFENAPLALEYSRRSGKTHCGEHGGTHSPRTGHPIMHSLHLTAALVIFHRAARMAPGNRKSVGHSLIIQTKQFARSGSSNKNTDDSLGVVAAPHHFGQQASANSPANFIPSGHRCEETFSIHRLFL